MKKIILSIAAIATVAVSIYLFAADHIDAPAVTGTSSDITDIFAFESPQNSDNLVLVCNLQGLLDPAATASASFDSNVMVEFNIDNTGDSVEDLVIQCLFENGQITAYGPVVPSQTGTVSQVETSANTVQTAITNYGDSPSVGNANGVSVFAGPRDDPFFFDFEQFNKVIAGDTTAFRSPGIDTFAGTNVLSVVVELPKSALGSGDIAVWAETKRRM